MQEQAEEAAATLQLLKSVGIADSAVVVPDKSDSQKDGVSVS